MPKQRDNSADSKNEQSDDNLASPFYTIKRFAACFKLKSDITKQQTKQERLYFSEIH